MSKIDSIKVAVLAGGIGPERQISLQSGNCVADALKQAGLNVTTSDITPEDLSILDDSSIDVFFPALHGPFGEDGQLQQIFEDKNLVYTGSGPATSRLAMNKLLSKEIFASCSILTPQAVEFKPGSKNLLENFSRANHKFVIKPVNQGSSVGISIVDTPQAAFEAGQKCFQSFGDCMIEQFIPGKEITVSILKDLPLPIVEIRSKSGFYDYNAKYIDKETEYLFDTITDGGLIEKINADAVACFNALGCRGFARADFILTDDGDLYILEINTIPGFTTHSLLPKAAQKIGISMSDLCTRIIKAALEAAQKVESE